MFVVDPSTSPMSIVAEYGSQNFPRDGCGGTQIGGNVYLLAGAGTTTTNPDQFLVYQARDEYPSAPAFLEPNSPLMTFWVGDMSGGRDGHGLGASAGGGYFVGL